MSRSHNGGGGQSTQYEYLRAGGRWRVNKNKLDGEDSDERERGKRGVYCVCVNRETGMVKSQKDRITDASALFSFSSQARINKTSTFSTTSDDILTLLCQLYSQSSKKYLKLLQIYFQ